jgi:pilus assembly protein CpaB
MLTITLAAVLGLVGVVAVFAYVRQADERAVNGVKAETVMVAAGAIPAGTSLTKAQQDHLLGTEKLPTSSLSTPAVQSVTASNEHLVMTANVAQGQVLLQNMLAPAASVTASGSFIVPPGMVAVAVDLCITEAVGNYLAAGSEVAVFDTIAGKGSQVQRGCQAQHDILNSDVIARPGGAATLLVLQKAEVLAVGQNPAAANTSGGNNVTASADPSSSSLSSQAGEEFVTLAVDQADAERLILIDEVGMPYLALLGPESSTAFTPPVNLFQEQP